MDDSEPGSSAKLTPKPLTPEQRERKSELQRERRAKRNPEQRENVNEYKRRRRVEETAVQRETRNELRRQKRVQKQNEESPGERARRNEVKRVRRAYQQNRRASITHNVARDQNVLMEEFYLGAMSVQCEMCEAFHFEAEKIVHGRNSHFSVCCENGNVILPPLKPYPEPLYSWLTSNDSNCKHFREHIRKYNSAFAFASFGYNPPKGHSQVTFPSGPQAYVIHGQVYHLTPQALTVDSKEPSYAQLYFLDPDYANAVRNNNVQSLQKGTSLTAWFELNSKCPESRQYLYSEMPYHYRYDTSKGEWIIRQRNKDKVLPRMYAVSPRDMERYSLRLLLLHVRGALSFDDLRTVNGMVCDTFQQAAIMMNLLEDDDVWIKTMEEAVQYQMPSELRVLLSSILTHGFATDAKLLYITFREHLMEDYRRKYDDDIAEQMCLRDIENHLKQHGEDKT